MPRADIYWIRGPWRGRLAIVPRPRGGDWLDDEVSGWKGQGLSVIVSLLTPEEIVELDLVGEPEACRSAGLGYRSLPIPDLGVPPSRGAAAELVDALDRVLADGKNVAIHCRQSIGRSSLLAASVLAASGISPRDAFREISKVRGTTVPETTEQQRWVETFAAALALQGNVA